MDFLWSWRYKGIERRILPLNQVTRVLICVQDTWCQIRANINKKSIKAISYFVRVREDTLFPTHLCRCSCCRFLAIQQMISEVPGWLNIVWCLGEFYCIIFFFCFPYISYKFVFIFLISFYVRRDGVCNCIFFTGAFLQIFSNPRSPFWRINFRLMAAHRKRWFKSWINKGYEKMISCINII